MVQYSQTPYLVLSTVTLTDNQSISRTVVKCKTRNLMRRPFNNLSEPPRSLRLCGYALRFTLHVLRSHPRHRPVHDLLDRRIVQCKLGSSLLEEIGQRPRPAQCQPALVRLDGPALVLQ